MGNHVCTDQRPFTLDDIRKTKEELPHRKALSETNPLLLRSTQQAFDGFEHNVKAFSFRLGGSGDNNAGNTGTFTNSSMVKRSNVVCTPVSLRDHVVVDPTCAYIVVHIKRSDTKQLFVPSSRSDTTTTLSGVPTWASDTFAAFTPRGVGTPFGVDVAAVRWRGRNSDDRFKFEYSLHVYNGRASHQLVVAVATMQAFQVEKLLLNDVELLQRLFYGFNAARPTDLPLPVSIGTLDFSDYRVDSSRSTASLNTVLQHHALLRHLSSVALDLLPGTPRQATSSASTSHVSPRGASTSTPPSSESLSTKKDLPSAPLVNDSCGQSMPVLPVPSLPRVPIGSVLTHDADEEPPLVNRRSPQKIDGQHDDDSSTVAALKSRTVASAPFSQPPKLNLSSMKMSGSRETSRAVSEDAANDTNYHQGGVEGDVSLGGTQQFVDKPSLRLPFAITGTIGCGLPTLNVRSTTGDATAEVDSGALDEEVDEVSETHKKIMKLREQAPVATEVLPWLFVGGEEAAKDRRQLLEKGITHVVNAAAHSIPNLFPDVFEYTPLYLCDSPDEPIFSLFPIVNGVIEDAKAAGGKTFVHCHQGVSRSCSLVIAYVMWKQGLCYDRAFDYVREHRRVCSPNSGFFVNLLRWEKQLSSPPRQCVWAFLPFNKDHTFPFTFRDQQQQQQSPFVFDSRVMYGLVSPSPEEAGEGSVHLLRGSECGDTYASAAFVALERHLRYNFYTGLPKQSTNNSGQDVLFQPSLLMRRRIAELTSSNPRARGITITALESHQQVAFQRDPTLNAVLQNDLPQLLEQHLEEQHRVLEATADRKRRRDETLGGPQAAVAASPETRRVPSAWMSSAARSDTGGNEETDAAENFNDESRHRVASTSPSAALLVDGDDSEPEGTDSILVFEYPFASSDPVEDMYSIDDLSTEKGYAIVVRGYRGSGVAATHRRPHRIFLWLGEDFTKDEETLQRAFRAAVSPSGALSGVKITSRTRLSNIEEEIVFEHDEPSELLLAFA